MPKKRFLILVLLFIFISAFFHDTDAQKLDKHAVKIHPGTAFTYLNGGKYGNKDTVPVSQFDSLLSRPLIVKDSQGREYPVHSFSIIYMNRGAYVDSTGRPIILSTPLFSASENGLLPPFWVKGLIPQVKAGDTAIFTDIRYINPNTLPKATLQYGTTMHLILCP